MTFTTSDTANCARQKWEKESQMFERSEFLTLPIFDSHNWEAEGQWQRGRLSLLTFFGEAKKVSGRRATPGQRRLGTYKAKKPKNKRHWIPPSRGAPVFANTSRLPRNLHANRNPRQSLLRNDRPTYSVVINLIFSLSTKTATKHVLALVRIDHPSNKSPLDLP